MLKIIRRERPGSSSLESPLSLARMSILPKSPLSLPSLRWWDGGKIPTHHKTPLLSLQLSSHSFLDSYLEDDPSASAVYTIKTTDAFTTVLRCNGEGDFTKIAMIKWPGGASTNKAGEDSNNGFLIKMGGHRWSKGQVFLRSGPHPDSSRKFAIPDYAHAMKWKRYGTSYWCTTSGVTGPIATLDLSKEPEPITLAVYETLHDKYDPQALTAYKGVSLLLLDYLIVTALLCTTDVTAWKLLGKVGDTPASHALDPDDRIPELLDHPFAARSGELRNAPSLTSLTTTVTTFPRPLEPYDIGMTPYFRSDASSSRRQSGSFESTREIWSEDYWPLLHGTEPTSSVESIQHSGVPSSHTFVRSSSISGSQNIPPVPSLPSKFVLSPNRPRRSASSSSSHHELSRRLDRAHTTAIHSQPLQLPVPEKIPGSLSSEQPQDVSTSTHLSHSPSQWRPLPKPPSPSRIRRIQSSTQLDAETGSGHSRSLPTTPVMDVAAGNANKASIAEGNSPLEVNALAPLTTKASQGDLAKWVNALKDSERALPVTPSSDTVVFSMPPPSYASIYYAQHDPPNCIPTSTAPPM